MISIPFSGSKRFAYKQVKPIVSLGQYNTVYEPFGGSGVLSVNLWNDGIVSHAVVNDYDCFFNDYEAYLDLKDLVVKKCYEAGLKKTTTPGGKYVSQHNPDGTTEIIGSEVLKGENRQKLQDIISEFVPEKYWPYFALGSQFMLGNNSSSGNYSIKNFVKFANDLTTDNQRQYLKVYNQLQIEHLDYRDFLDKFTYNSKSVLLVDPPYIGTSMGQYAKQFQEGDTEELVEKLKRIGCDFIFFNSEMEQVKKWLRGLEAEYFVTGRKNRPDIMAYVRFS